MESYNLFSENYYDSLSEEYYKIISINKIPNGELKKYIKKIAIKSISTNDAQNTKYCRYVINSSILKNNDEKINICTINNINEIYEF